MGITFIFVYTMHRIAQHYNKDKNMEMTQENEKQVIEILKDPDKAIQYLTDCVKNDKPKAFTFALSTIIEIYDIDISDPLKEMKTKHHAICDLTNHCICDDEDNEENHRKMESIVKSLVPSKRAQILVKYKEFALSQAILHLISEVYQVIYHQSFSEKNKYTVLR